MCHQFLWWVAIRYSKYKTNCCSKSHTHVTWRNSSAIFPAYRTNHTYRSSDRPMHCTLSQSVSQSVSMSHAPVPQFCISSKLSTDWAYVPVRGSITMQRVNFTHYLHHQFLKLPQISSNCCLRTASRLSFEFLRHLLFLLNTLIIFCPYTHFYSTSNLEASCSLVLLLKFPNSVSSHLMPLFLHLP